MERKLSETRNHSCLLFGTLDAHCQRRGISASGHTVGQITGTSIVSFRGRESHYKIQASCALPVLHLGFDLPCDRWLYGCLDDYP